MPLPTHGPVWLPRVLSKNSNRPALNYNHCPGPFTQTSSLPLLLGLMGYCHFLEWCLCFSPLITVPSPTALRCTDPSADCASRGQIRGDPSQAERRAPPTAPHGVVAYSLRLPHWTGSSGMKGCVWCSPSRCHSSPGPHVPGNGAGPGCGRAGGKTSGRVDRGASTSLLPAPCVLTGWRGSSYHQGPKVCSGTVVPGKGSWKAWQFVSLPPGGRKGPTG